MKPNDTVNLCFICWNDVEKRGPCLNPLTGHGVGIAAGYCHMCGDIQQFVGNMKRNDPRLKGHELFYEKEVEEKNEANKK